jgi:hypothetical protein
MLYFSVIIYIYIYIYITYTTTGHLKDILIT